MERFAVSPAQLGLLAVPGKEEENRLKLAELGGGPGICSKLLSDEHRGVPGSPEDLASRRGVFGENKTRVPEIESEWHARSGCDAVCATRRVLRPFRRLDIPLSGLFQGSHPDHPYYCCIHIPHRQHNQRTARGSWSSWRDKPWKPALASALTAGFRRWPCDLLCYWTGRDRHCD